MREAWSQRVAARYHLQLPDDLAAWLEDEVWRNAGGAEFSRPLSPEQLLEPEPGVVWAGFMLPDTLPVIGNRYGDWLCLRVAADGSVREVIYWCHAGGDWVPYGNTLSEALLYDAAFRVMYPRRPEFVDPEPPKDEVFRAAEWARGWIERRGVQLRPFWQEPLAGQVDPLDELLAADCSVVAVRRDRLLRNLESTLKTHSNPGLAKAVGTVWEPDFVSWLFDTALIPELRAEDLSRRFRVPVADLMLQDWEAAEAEAVEVSRMRQDLGWALDIAGWAAERRGDVQLAIERYFAGVHASLFADESIKFRTHWFAEGYGKFSAARLARLNEHLPAEMRDDPYLNILWQNDPESLRARVRDYWMQQATTAEQAGQPLRAYHGYYNAGWDLGLQYLTSYRELLDRMIGVAESAESPALASIARLHRRFLS